VCLVVPPSILNSATHFFPSRSLRFTDTNFGIIYNGYIHLGLFGSATWKAEEDPVRVWEGRADQLYADPRAVEEAQADHGGEEQGSGGGGNFCVGRDKTKLTATENMVRLGVQYLSIFGQDLTVALNTRNHHQALKILTAIMKITFECITRNGGLR
jgi:hypothetical protein